MKSSKTKTNTNKKQAVARPLLLSITLLLTMLILSSPALMAQCALCTKTAQQLGNGPASGLNKGIIYLMCIPLGLLSVIGYKWYKKEKATRAIEDAA